MIVDDEQTITDTLCMIFEHEGYDCLRAYSAEQALTIALKTPPDLLLTDVVLPQMNGIQLAIELRSHFPTMQSILLSGQAGTAQLLEEARAQGFEFEVFAKPMPPLELIGHVNKRLTR